MNDDSNLTVLVFCPDTHIFAPSDRQDELAYLIEEGHFPRPCGKTLAGRKLFCRDEAEQLNEVEEPSLTDVQVADLFQIKNLQGRVSVHAVREKAMNGEFSVIGVAGDGSW